MDNETQLPQELLTFFDVAKVFKWAAEYSDENGGQLHLSLGQWSIISDDDEGMQSYHAIAPSNVAELYCLQCGVEKEEHAAYATLKAQADKMVEALKWIQMREGINEDVDNVISGALADYQGKKEGGGNE